MSQPTPERVRVTGPPRRRTPRGARTSDIDEETRLGAIYMRSLMSEQLRLALLVLGGLMLTVGVLPLLFHLVPGLSGVAVAGVPLSWLLLGALVYPYLILLGWLYIRRAERNERDFADLVAEVVPEEVAQQPSRRVVPEEVAQPPSLEEPPSSRTPQ